MRGEDGVSPSPLSAECADHPHARGRRYTANQRIFEWAGSPPCAGKTGRRADLQPAVGHHPRMRGEDQRFLRMPATRRTSPPHARGRLVNEPFGGNAYHITPACAGKTPAHLVCATITTDHPRMRGEDIRTPNVAYDKLGSPPHARGRLHPRLDLGDRVGITPACAGKTNKVSWFGLRFADHPRMRGEDIHAQAADVGSAGSPPHARGRRTQLWRPRFCRGITPACAGKTSHGDRERQRPRDHPRMRGEDRLCRRLA